MSTTGPIVTKLICTTTLAPAVIYIFIMVWVKKWLIIMMVLLMIIKMMMVIMMMIIIMHMSKEGMVWPYLALSDWQRHHIPSNSRAKKKTKKTYPFHGHYNVLYHHQFLWLKKNQYAFMLYQTKFSRLQSSLMSVRMNCWFSFFFFKYQAEIYFNARNSKLPSS